jgi:5-methyltetrahydropteroyltriglutamate--homocysteine methyltransferase
MTQPYSEFSVLPTEPVGSIPRPDDLIAKFQQFELGRLSQAELALAEDAAVADTIAQFEATGSPVITDGEQRKPSFLTYPLRGLDNIAVGDFGITFADGHVRRVPRLTEGPFRYRQYAVDYLRSAKQKTSRAVKQAVITASALSLIYPKEGLPGYPREEFICDLLNEVERDIRQCLDAGADSVQMDFTEARLAIKLDPTLALLEEFIEINNWVLERFSADERRRICVHSCPGSDCDATHSAEVNYEFLLPALFRLHAGRFCIQLSSERDRPRVLRSIRASLEEEQLIFVGVIDPTDPNVESAEEVRDRVLEAARFLPLDRLGTTDDCGFAPFADDRSTPRDTAFRKIKARLDGTRMAREILLGS